MERKKIQFSVETSVQSYTVELWVTPNEHNLLKYLKYKLNQAYSDSELCDNFYVDTNVINN